MTEAARLERIRGQLAAIEPATWSRAHDGSGCFIEAAGPMGELCEVARFHAGATGDEIAFAVDAPGHVRFLLGLVDRAIAKLRLAEGRKGDRPSADVGRPAGGPASAAGGTAREAKDFAAEAAMKCGEPAFKKWLEESHGLERPLTDERAAQKLRSLLGVTSRAELNSDTRAAARWKKLRGEFEAWRKAG